MTSRLLCVIALTALAACPYRRVPLPSTMKPVSVRIIEAVAEAETGSRSSRREDVDARTRDGRGHPAVLRTSQSDLLKFEAGARAILAGDAAGTKGFEVDDFLLLEILDSSGAVVDRMVVGYHEGVNVGGSEIDNAGPNSFRFGPGEVDVSERLPTGSPFRVRATALDRGNVGRVTDVYLLLGPWPSDGDEDRER